MTYHDKEILKLDDLIKVLERRWLLIQDKSKAKHYLSHIWYYRLSWYFKYFQDWDDNFKMNTNFEQVLNIYRFDRYLRLLLLDLLERIESSIKTCLVDNIWLGLKDKYFIYNKDNYKNLKVFNFTLDYLNNEIERASKNEMMIRHNCEYENIWKLPVWILVNLLSFGTIVRILSNFSKENKKSLKNCYQIKVWILLNWFIWLNDLRNYCAHHNRVWNRKIKKLRTYENFKWYNNRDSLFAYLIVINYFIKIISSTSSWKEKLVKLIERYEINIEEMWFPNNWQEILEIEN